MPLRQGESAEDGNVRDRLLKAADAEIALRGVGAIRMEAVAKRAGMSRSTAFRHIGSVYELVIQVALVHARRHMVAIRELMSDCSDAFMKLEAALVYSASQLRTDPTISALITEHVNSAHHPKVHAAALEVLGPVLRDGQQCGAIRADLGIDELVDFVVEQVYLAAQADDRSDSAARRRFRHFVEPGIAAPGGVTASRAPFRPEIEVALQTTVAAVEELSRVLREHQL